MPCPASMAITMSTRVSLVSSPSSSTTLTTLSRAEYFFICLCLLFLSKMNLFSFDFVILSFFLVIGIIAVVGGLCARGDDSRLPKDSRELVHDLLHANRLARPPSPCRYPRGSKISSFYVSIASVFPSPSTRFRDDPFLLVDVSFVSFSIGIQEGSR